MSEWPPAEQWKRLWGVASRRGLSEQEQVEKPGQLEQPKASSPLAMFFFFFLFHRTKHSASSERVKCREIQRRLSVIG